MSDLYINKNKYKVLAAKKRAISYTDKFEKILSAIISMLATFGIFRAILQSLS